MDRWVEAICISMQTAREAKLSLTGAVKNISKIVSEYDFNSQALIDKITEENNKKLPLEVADWDGDVELVLQKCSATRDNMVETFDGCLSLKP